MKIELGRRMVLVVLVVCALSSSAWSQSLPSGSVTIEDMCCQGGINIALFVDEDGDAFIEYWHAGVQNPFDPVEYPVGDIFTDPYDDPSTKEDEGPVEGTSGGVIGNSGRRLSVGQLAAILAYLERLDKETLDVTQGNLAKTVTQHHFYVSDCHIAYKIYLHVLYLLGETKKK